MPHYVGMDLGKRSARINERHALDWYRDGLVCFAEHCGECFGDLDANTEEGAVDQHPGRAWSRRSIRMEFECEVAKSGH